MKFDKLLLLILVCVCATSLCAQDKITIAVVDTHGNALSYPEIIVGTDLHRVGTEKGTLDIPLQLLNSGDTLTVKYLGFKTSRTVLSGAVLSDKLLRIILEDLISAAFFLVRKFYMLRCLLGALYFDMRRFGVFWVFSKHKIPRPNQWGSIKNHKK